jgi:thymidine phosphorylase
VLDISGEILVLAGLAPDAETGSRIALEQLDSGAAAAKFDEILEAQGGVASFTSTAREVLPTAAFVKPVLIDGEGWLRSMNTREVGLTLVQLGGGRTRPTDSIDFTVGFTAFAQLGDRLDADHPVCVIHARSEAEWEAAAARVLAALEISAEQAPAAGPIVLERLAGAPRTQETTR